MEDDDTRGLSPATPRKISEAKRVPSEAQKITPTCTNIIKKVDKINKLFGDNDLF